MRKAADPGEQLQEVRKLAANKKCFDCGHSGTTYVISDIGIFVCSICAGIHREFSHRAKGLSMSNFTQAEVDKLISTGNDKAAKSWMARHNPRTHPIPDVKDLFRLKEFMRQKYIEKRFYGEIREEEKDQRSWAQFEDQKTEVRPVTTLTSDNRPAQKPQNLLDMDESPQPRPPVQPSIPQPPPAVPLNKPAPNLFPGSTDSTNGKVKNGQTSHKGSAESTPKSPTPSLFPPPGAQFTSTPQISIPTQVPITNTQVPISTPQVPIPTQHVPISTQHVPISTQHVPISTPQNPIPQIPANPQVQLQSQPNYPPSYPPGMTYPTSTSPTVPNTGFFPGNPYSVPNPSVSYPNPSYGGMNYPQYQASNMPSYMPSSSVPSSSADPFDSIIEEDRLRKLHEQQEKARRMPNNQNIMMQQYMVQAQLYQQTYGVPYPYSFQQWYAVMHPNQAPPAPQHSQPAPSSSAGSTHSAPHPTFTSLSNLGSSQGPEVSDPFSGVKATSQKSNNPFDMFG